MNANAIDLRAFVGRNYDQVNCWQLVREFYLKLFHVELERYCDFTPESRQTINSLVAQNISDFEEINKPQFGDLILIKILGIESHVAIFVGQGKMLHSHRGTGSVIDSVEKWRPRISGFYRLKRK